MAERDQSVYTSSQLAGQDATRAAKAAYKKQITDAEQLAADADARAAASVKALANMKTNFAADLGIDTTSSVVAGGTADLASGAVDLGIGKRRRTASGLASTLGINI